MMLDANIGIYPALVFYSEVDDTALCRVVKKMSIDVASGHNLSNAMRSYPRLFSPTYIALTESGEKSGKLSVTFRRLARLLERQMDVKSQVISALASPAINAVVFSVAVICFIYFILPMMAPIFHLAGDEIPAPTRVLLGLQRIIPWFVSIVSLVLIGNWLLRPWRRLYFKRRPEKMLSLARIPLLLPVVSKVYEKLSAARILFSLCSMLESGLMLTNALTCASLASGNVFIIHRFSKVVQDIREGSSLAEALQLHRAFPAGATQMLSIGEETARLAEMAEHVAVMYEFEVELAINDLVALIEPLMMAAMGIIVGFFVFAAALPTIRILDKI